MRKRSQKPRETNAPAPVLDSTRDNAQNAFRRGFEVSSVRGARPGVRACAIPAIGGENEAENIVFTIRISAQGAGASFSFASRIP
jgi:hypothetical protein